MSCPHHLRHTPFSPRRASLVLGLVALLTLSAACRSDPAAEPEPFDLAEPGADMRAADMSSEPDDAAPDLAVMQPDLDVSTPDLEEDMGSADMPEEDMAVEDMAPIEPLRQLTTLGLMGDMPVENLVKDPLFMGINRDYTWLVLAGDQRSFLTTYRRTNLDTPQRAPSLFVPKAPINPSGVVMYGELMLHRAPLLISVWIGRPINLFGGPAPAPEVLAYGMNTTNLRDLAGVTLRAEPQSIRAIGGVSWTRYEAQVQGFAGYGYMVISDNAAQALHVHAPQATVIPASPNALLRPGAQPVALTGLERERLNQIIEYVRREREQTPPPTAHDRPTPYPF